MNDNFKNFVDIWKPYQKELFWFVDYNLDKCLERDFTTDEDPEIKKRREFIFEQVKQVQYALLDIGEDNLVIEPMYHWEELKIKYPRIKDVGFKTPFSYLCHWLSLPHLSMLEKDQGFRDALFIVCDYLDLLTHKLNNET
jgi:hypothetical protein